jgi:hypothetical protein
MNYQVVRKAYDNAWSNYGIARDRLLTAEAMLAENKGKPSQAAAETELSSAQEDVKTTNEAQTLALGKLIEFLKNRKGGRKTLRHRRKHRKTLRRK